MTPSIRLLKRMLAPLLLLCLAWICWKFQPWMPRGHAIHLRSAQLGTYEFQIWQRKNGLLNPEPFATALFVRKSGAPWTAYLLDIQDLYREEITLRKEDSGVAVLYGKTRRAYFDEKQDAYTLYHCDGQSELRSGTVIDSEPPGNWWEQLSAVVAALDEEHSPPKNVPLNRPGEYVFHFHSEKNQEMTLLLEVQGSRGEPDRQELASLQVTIEARVQNQSGRTVCYAVGSPKNDVGADKWALMTSGGEAAFWKRNCAEIKLKRSESYVITISIRDVDPKTPKIEVTPIFQRSDNYVP